MDLFTQSQFTARGIRSLSWCGDELVDWVGGGRAFALDGTERRAAVNYAYRFDAVTVSPDGRFAVIYERQGTKGLLLDGGKILRELNRSFYQAAAYEYPVALFHEPGGRLLLAHCPADYNHIEIEEAESGKVLTACSERKPSDFFHSRLAASPNGKRLLSAGWVWHPLGRVLCFDIARGLADPRHLDDGDYISPSLAEQNSACWLDDDHIVVGASNETELYEENEDAITGPCLLPRGLAVYDLANGTCLQSFQLDEQPGTILAIGANHVLSLYRHPKLIDLWNGTTRHEWPALNSGRQDGSIIWHLKDETKLPPTAFDPATSRFAIANDDAVTVIQFNPSAMGSHKWDLGAPI